MSLVRLTQIGLLLQSAVLLLGFNFSRPDTLADFVNRVGSSRNVTHIAIIYNSRNMDSSYFDDFLVALRQNRSSYFAQRPQFIANENNHLKLSYDLSPKAMVLTLAESVHDEILNVTAVTIRGRRYCYTMFAVRNVQNEQELKAIFDIIWLRQFRRPLVIANNRHLFTMRPYPKLKVWNVTTGRVWNYFPPGSYTNMRGYQIHLPVQVDIPQTFWYQDHVGGPRCLDGIGGRIFLEFMNKLNVSVTFFALYSNQSNFLNMSVINQQLLTNEIEISPHMVPTLDIEDVEYSYPYEVTTRCLMLPLDNEISRHLYLLLPFRWSLWILIIGLVIAVELSSKIWCKYRGKRVTTSVGVGLCAFCLILAKPIPGLKSPNKRKMLLPYFLCYLACYTILAVSGICISHTYATVLTSFMTVTLFAKPSASVEDVVKSQIPIMILRREEHALFSYTDHLNPLKPLTVYGGNEEYHLNRYNMNRSYIYPISAARWRFLNFQQHFLKHKRFWFSDICAGQYLMQYQMRYDSHFYKPLVIFILRVRESGLFEHWKSKAFWRARKMGYVQFFEEETDFHKGLTLKLFSPIICLWIGGMIVSVCVFLGELKYAVLLK